MFCSKIHPTILTSPYAIESPDRPTFHYPLLLEVISQAADQLSSRGFSLLTVRGNHRDLSICNRATEVKDILWSEADLVFCVANGVEHRASMDCPQCSAGFWAFGYGDNHVESSDRNWNLEVPVSVFSSALWRVFYQPKWSPYSVHNFGLKKSC